MGTQWNSELEHRPGDKKIYITISRNTSQLLAINAKQIDQSVLLAVPTNVFCVWKGVFSFIECKTFGRRHGLITV